MKRDKRELGRNFDKSSHQRSVERFMRAGGQEVPDKPCIPSEEVRMLRAKLILEEALETIEALGISVELSQQSFEEFHTALDAMCIDDFVFQAADGWDDIKPNLEAIADGCADIAVVTTGTLSACGIVDTPIQEEVNRTNLAKIHPDGTVHKREDGKILKPDGWQPPRIRELLEEQ